MKRLLLPIFVFALSFAQDKQFLISAFESAAAEFNVPADVLKGIAFAETRWEHLTWVDGDTASCMGMPRPYGVMSLWDNDYFGHSLREAAALIGQDPDVLKRNIVQNIRGAAALLAKLHNDLPLPEGTAAGDVESWRGAIVKYCGIPQEELAQQHALDIYTQMSKGYHQYHISWDGRAVNLPLIQSSVEKVWSQAREAKNTLRKGTEIANQPDYPYAKWASAYAGTGQGDQHWYTMGYRHDFVVEHDMEGYYLSTISYFQMSATQASIYYCVNGLKDNSGDAPAGEITQMVEEKYWAWHVICWNRYMFGIEHEGFVSNPAWYTDTLYKASARLTAYLCTKYKIPPDRNHIIGHDEHNNQSWINWLRNTYNPQLPVSIPPIDSCNSHTDPGSYWNWTYYMSLVNSYMSPTIVSVAPQPNQTNTRLYKSVTITFSALMDSTSTTAAFSISPAVTGTFQWNNDYSALTFVPSILLSPGTTYTVKIDSTAKSKSLDHSLDGNGDGTPNPYQFTFTTEPSRPLLLSLLDTYPKRNDVGIPVNLDLFVLTSAPLEPSSVVTRFDLRENNGSVVPLTSFSIGSVNEQGTITITPLPLKRNTAYQLRILAGIQDLYGNTTQLDDTVSFRSSPDSVLQGIVFDGFESNARGWIQPLQNPVSTLIDSSATYFVLSAERKRSGSAAGKLAFKFKQSFGGVVDLKASGSPIFDSYNSFGLWVCGDENRNRLKAIFQPQNQQVDFGIVNWRGWKFLSTSLGAINGPNKQISDFIVQQVDSGTTGNVLYFDDMQVNSTVTDAEFGSPVALKSFALKQNFPNPFNPATTLSFQIPSKSHVHLAVYDVLGRQVALLLNEERSAGSYAVTWDASRVTSGVYFYRLVAGNYIETKKMILLR